MHVMGITVENFRKYMCKSVQFNALCSVKYAQCKNILIFRDQFDDIKSSKEAGKN